MAFQKFTNLDPRSFKYILIAFTRLVEARIFLWRTPVEQILKHINRDGHLEDAGRPTPKELPSLRRLGWALAAVGARVPWRADCLVQVIAGTAWLRSHGINPQTHIGVRLDESGALRAHAWLTVDGKVVTGGNIESGFVQLKASG